MLRDRYDQSLTTHSATATDAYVHGCESLFSLYPGAGEAFDRATTADPDFALAHLGKARALLMANDPVAATASLTKAQSLTERLLPREKSYVELMRLMFAGQSGAAIALVKSHIREWPSDAIVLSLTSNPAGLIWVSGRIGREQDLVDLMGSVAQHYGDDWWFNADYAMALSDNGQQELARPKIEQSMAKNPRNAWGAHALGHLHYECGKHDDAIAFMQSWLQDYPKDGMLWGHLHWHAALSRLHIGDYAEGLRLFNDAFGADDFAGMPRFKIIDAASFLWRAELAGHPRDPDRWRKLHELGRKMFAKPSTHLVDWHLALVDAVVGDGTALEERIRGIQDLAGAGRYPSGQVVPSVSRAFAAFQRHDYPTTISILEPIFAERVRIGGSRAQVDLVEATLMKAYINTGRLENLSHLLDQRRPGPGPIPLDGLDHA